MKRRGSAATGALASPRRRWLAAVAVAGLGAVVVYGGDAPNQPFGKSGSDGEPLTAAGEVTGTAAALTRYPYLTDLVNRPDGTLGYVTVNWATDRSASKSVVRWGRSGQESCTANSAEASRTGIVVNGVAQYQWKASFAVTPDTKYCYRVYLQGADELDLLGSAEAPTFLSQLPAGSKKPFSFAVFGDWGKVGPDGSNVHQSNLLRQMAASGARFAMSTGDTGYPAGTQSSHGDLHQKGADVSAVFGPDFWPLVGASMPLFSAVGNHDPNSAFVVNWPQDKAVATSGGRSGMETFCCLNDTASESYANVYYAFDVGDARFYVLNTSWEEGNLGTGGAYKNNHDYHWTPESPQYQWLSNDLAANESKLKFALLHYPFHSDQTSEPSNTFLQGPSSLEGLLSRNGVDVAFSGHAHIYQRTLKPGPDGLVSYVTGGGGASLQSVGGGGCSAIDAYAIGFTPSSRTGSACGSAPVPEAPERVYHFLLVTVDGMKVTVTPTDELGRSFDVQTYDFAAGGAAPPTIPVVSAAALGGDVDLSWPASTDDIGVNGYRVFRNGSLLGAVAGETTTYTDAGVSAGTAYSYEVEAFDGNGLTSPRSSAATVTTGRSNATFTFFPTDDTTIDSTRPRTNNGAATTMRVDGDRLQHSLLKFTVSGLNGCTVTRARLRLSPNDAEPGESEVFGVADANWSEASVTWAGAPHAGPTPVATVRAGTPSDVHEATITALVTGDGIVSLRLAPRSTNGTNYSSKEERRGGDHRPQLVVECLGTMRTGP